LSEPPIVREEISQEQQMNTTPERHELRIEVSEGDIDMLGHVNNVVYLRWVQDAAVSHWLAAAAPADQKALLWVVLRHEIDYKHPAFLDDEILARTWVGTASRRAFERHTELLRGSDARLLARARTLWCPIDPKTGKPTDVSDEVRARFSSQ
jgi:acyl-CoA thioester hydrolase